MGHFVSKISNFEVDLSEDVTGLVPLQIFKGIKKGSAPGTGFARIVGSPNPMGPSLGILIHEYFLGNIFKNLITGSLITL